MKVNIQKYIFPFVFLFSFVTFLLHLTYTRTSLYSDTRFYFAYTRSLVKDFDIDLKNDFEILGVKPAINKIGLSVNTYPPGAPLTWIPAYLAADIVYSITNSLLGLPKTTGVEILYQVAVGAENMLLATIGLLLSYKVLKKYFSEKSSLLGVFTLFLTTNLFFYMAIEPLTSHAISFFSISLFFYYFIIHKKDKYYYFVLGLIGGFSGLTRTQNLLILTLPVLDYLQTKRPNIKKLIILNGFLILGALITFSPQIILWKLFFNIFFTGPTWGYGFNFLKPKIIYVLLNTQNGLFTLTPVVMFSLIGFFYIKKEKKLGLLAVTYFLIQLFLVSSWKEYFQGGSYSIRMLVNTYPLLVLGLTALIDYLLKKTGEFKTFFLISFFFLLNAYQIIHYLLKF